MDDLPKEIHQKVQKLAAKGDSFADRDRFEDALPIYEAALELLPGEASDWEAGLWLIAAIGDALFHSERFEEAVERLASFSESELAVNSAFFQLRWGQCLLKVGKTDEAAIALKQAHAIEGDSIFEEEDPEYLAFFEESA